MSIKSYAATGIAALTITLASPLLAQEVTVDGYIDAAGGSVWKNSSGECWRSGYQDSSELLGECGYEEVVETAVEVDQGVGATDVKVIEMATIMKNGKVVTSGTAVVEQVTINNVQFDFDSAELNDAYRAELDSVSAILEPHRPMLRDGLEHVNVIGYTDSRGPADYNQKLSKRRARAVADHLVAQDPSRGGYIRVYGHGESNPIASNETEEGRRKNRRVVIEVVRN